MKVKKFKIWYGGKYMMATQKMIDFLRQYKHLLIVVDGE